MKDGPLNLEGMKTKQNSCILSLNNLLGLSRKPFHLLERHSKTCRNKFTHWVRADRKWAPEHDWKWWEVPPITPFPGWRSTQFLSAALGLLVKLIFSWPLLPALLMQRVPNDLVLSEVLKSQIPTDYYSAIHGLALSGKGWEVLIYRRLTQQNEHLLM